MTQRSALAVLVLVAAAVAAAAPAEDRERALACPPSVVGTVMSCSDSGTVFSGSNMTYTFLADGVGGTAFDLVFSLHAQSGDADLAVLTPSGQQLVSMHGSGEDVVFIPRGEVLPGRYRITVVGSSEQSSYKLTVEKHERLRSLAAADRAALGKVLHSKCCARPGSCATLRNGLLGAAPAAAAAGSGASGGSGYVGADDLCNTGRNLCDVDGHLVHLALVNEYLECPFPASLGELPALTQLDLTMNDLSGHLDREVAAVVTRLPGLQNLRLAHNRVGGTLSCDLVAGPLRELDVAANQVKGPILPCIVQAPAIQELYLGNNLLTGPLPRFPADSKLLIISAHSNGLFGGLPDVASLAQLEALVLNSNNFSGRLPELPDAMRHVNLEHNALSGAIPEQWGGLDGLEVARLGHNQLSGGVPDGLARQQGLELLLLGHNRLSGGLPAEWTTTQLQRLDVQDNALTGPLPAALGALPALAVLQAGGNGLDGGLDAFAQAAAGASRLEVVSLEDNRFEGPVPDSFGQLHLLTSAGYTLLDGLSVPPTLDLGENQLSGSFPSWLAEAVVRGNAAVNVEGNRLACPEEVEVSAEPLPGRTVGLECFSADGRAQSIDGLMRVANPAAQPQHAEQAQHGGGQATGEEAEIEAPAAVEEEEGQGAEEGWQQEQAPVDDAEEGGERHQEQQQGQAGAAAAQASTDATSGASSAAEQGEQEARDVPAHAAAAPAQQGAKMQDDAASAGADAAKQQAAAAGSGSGTSPSGAETSSDGGSGAGGSSWLVWVVVVACLGGAAKFVVPRVTAALQGTRQSSPGQYAPVLPHSYSAASGSFSPLASPNMWAKEQQLALLDPGASLLNKPKAWSHRSGGGRGGSASPGARGGAAGQGGAEQAEEAAGDGPFSIGTRVHVPDAADDLV